ncbi:Malonyl CoA-acyl carrier protein transacylase [Fulvivirga imtechensis AK7]|uniref:Malonyl CoA-acyl carrier protein transacylase n=1 Tax=Fulvivirga imtechensis AK7 TaxID=1237149 RepID=L8JTH8_9BACT|nr:type I polyketide synthase [Fulvivirga imtechensis]ELR72271.1 Malonyl CoA-acyl carrier protein transacylase [Fulvivirga imtechensis AK7]
MKNSNSSRTGLEIAIIGMAGRFPGAEDITEYWQNLLQGKETIARFTEEELALNVPEKLYSKRNYVRAKGYLKNIQYFDPQFFGYNKKEASQLSPQSRVFQECIWEAFEDAGYNIQKCQGSIGIYAGASSSLMWQLLTSMGTSSDLDHFSAALLNDKDYLCTRASYQLNLNGPSVTINTACSTSLVAIHMACRALLTRECDMALAGGVTVTLPTKSGYMYENGMINSPDGHCRPFDNKANGTVFSDGGGVVLLKRLSHAIEDGDNIHAVILGSAINNDGNSKVGFTAPSATGQADVIKQAYKVSKISPESISYIETHGTGTPIGDPIEIEALKTVFNKNQSIHLGSVKSNIGHLDVAAGVASLLKVIMALKHKQIPETLHFSELNDKIDITNTCFSINNGLRTWKVESVLRAGVNSFGIGGTNAHVILEEAPLPEVSTTDEEDKQLMLFSAKTDKSLEKYLAKVKTFLTESSCSLADLAYTQNFGRAWFDKRVAICFSGKEDLEKKLTQLIEKKNFSQVKARQKVIFAFGGIGAEYPNMGLDLYLGVKSFREIFQELQSILELDIIQQMYKSPQLENQQYFEENKEIILFCFEYALAKLFMRLGQQPFFMIGHGVGEYVAATLSGVISLKDAYKILLERKKVNSAHFAPALLSIQSNLAGITPYLNGNGLSVAACNSEFSTIVSGDQSNIQEFKEELDAMKIRSVAVPNTQVFNASKIEIDGFAELFSTICINEPEIPYISCITGEKVDALAVKNIGYWMDLMLNPIRFDLGINELLKYENTVFLELSPSMVISSWINRNKLKLSSQMAISVIRNKHDRVSDLSKLNEVLTELWKKGLAVQFNQLEHCNKGKRTSIPTYQFDRKFLWVEKEHLGVSAINSFYTDSDDRKDAIRGNFTKREIEEQLCKIWGQVINETDINPEKNLFESGITSLDAINANRLIKMHIGVELEITIMFEHPTIKSYAAYLFGIQNELTPQNVDL